MRLSARVDGERAHSLVFDVPAVARIRRDLSLDRGFVAGVVRDERGAPLAGIQLLLTSDDADLEDRLVESDSSGAFRFERVPEGIASLHYGERFRRDGHAELGSFGRRTTVVTVGAEGGVELDLELRPGGAIEGRVRSADGSAPPFCRVELTDAEGLALDRVGLFTADPTGRFTLEGLPSVVRVRAVDGERKGPWVEIGVPSGETVQLSLEL
jgi:hypothetical protein